MRTALKEKRLARALYVGKYREECKRCTTSAAWFIVRRRKGK